MATIVPASQAGDLGKSLNKEHHDLVLVGGCFDLLHEGHRQFLREAEKQGDAVCVLLESDEMIRAGKGAGRPYQTQLERAKHLAKLREVTSIILLPASMTDSDYDKLVSEIKPAIIATTKGDPYRHHKERQAKKVHALVRDVIDRIPGLSTTEKSKHYEYQ